MAGFVFSAGSGGSLATAGVPMMLLEFDCFSFASSSLVAVGSGGVGRVLGLSSPPPQAASTSAAAAVRLISVLVLFFMQWPAGLLAGGLCLIGAPPLTT